jgi:hypothetical protein
LELGKTRSITQIIGKIISSLSGKIQDNKSKINNKNIIKELFNVFFAILFLLCSLFSASQHENIRNIPITRNPHEIIVESQKSQQIFHILVVITFMLPDLLKYQVTNKIAHSIIQ